MNERKRGDGKRVDKQIGTNLKGERSSWIAVISYFKCAISSPHAKEHSTTTPPSHCPLFIGVATTFSTTSTYHSRSCANRLIEKSLRGPVRFKIVNHKMNGYQYSVMKYSNIAPGRQHKFVNLTEYTTFWKLRENFRTKYF
jgi:hypothetical protein